MELPGWVFSSALGKKEATSKLAADGGGDGTYLLRQHKKQGQFVLSVVYDGAATHHLIKPGPTGEVRHRLLVRAPDSPFH